MLPTHKGLISNWHHHSTWMCYRWRRSWQQEAKGRVLYPLAVEPESREEQCRTNWADRANLKKTLGERVDHQLGKEKRDKFYS